MGSKKISLLSSYTTLKIGGGVKNLFFVHNHKELIAALKSCARLKLPFFILGEGSNILAADSGYKGVVIKIEGSKIQVEGEDITADAGVLVRNVVNVAQKNEFAGFEWATGIPGTMGAAVYGNIGAFGSTIAGNVKLVEALNAKTFKTKKLSSEECKFGNKESIFKKNKNLIILSVTISLKKGDPLDINKEIRRFSDYRRNNHPLELPSAGCIFKNYEKKITDQKLLEKYPELVEFNKGSRIPISYLIDKCGLKGKIIGKAQVSQKHANFIVNLGGAKASDVVKLIKMIKKKVKDKFNIKLIEEVQYLK